MRALCLILCVLIGVILVNGIFAMGIFTGSKLEMPSYATSGEKVVIECKLDQEKYDIEHVKWYKNNQLFYVIIPSKDNPATSVDIEGIHVDTTESTMDKVVLNSITEQSSGLYTCELKTEHGMARMSGTLTVYSSKE